MITIRFLLASALLASAIATAHAMAGVAVRARRLVSVATWTTKRDVFTAIKTEVTGSNPWDQRTTGTASAIPEV